MTYNNDPGIYGIKNVESESNSIPARLKPGIGLIQIITSTFLGAMDMQRPQLVIRMTYGNIVHQLVYGLG